MRHALRGDAAAASVARMSASARCSERREERAARDMTSAARREGVVDMKRYFAVERAAMRQRARPLFYCLTLLRYFQRSQPTHRMVATALRGVRCAKRRVAECARGGAAGTREVCA